MVMNLKERMLFEMCVIAVALHCSNKIITYFYLIWNILKFCKAQNKFIFPPHPTHPLKKNSCGTIWWTFSLRQLLTFTSTCKTKYKRHVTPRYNPFYKKIHLYFTHISGETIPQADPLDEKQILILKIKLVQFLRDLVAMLNTYNIRFIVIKKYNLQVFAKNFMNFSPKL